MCVRPALFRVYMTLPVYPKKIIIIRHLFAHDVISHRSLFRSQARTVMGFGGLGIVGSGLEFSHLNVSEWPPPAKLEASGMGDDRPIIHKEGAVWEYKGSWSEVSLLCYRVLSALLRFSGRPHLIRVFPALLVWRRQVRKFLSRATRLLSTYFVYKLANGDFRR